MIRMAVYEQDRFPTAPQTFEEKDLSEELRSLVWSRNRAGRRFPNGQVVIILESISEDSHSDVRSLVREAAIALGKTGLT